MGFDSESQWRLRPRGAARNPSCRSISWPQPRRFSCSSTGKHAFIVP
jgi:hypothetical protein